MPVDFCGTRERNDDLRYLAKDLSAWSVVHLGLQCCE